MIIIQLVVIIVALGLLLLLLGGRQTHASKAWKKIGFCILIVAMIVSVLFPNVTNVVANFVGVGRGADLLLYLLTMAFFGYVINNYLCQQRDKDVIYRLARKIALLDANSRYGIKK